MKTPDKTFDASDVADGYALAYEQVADLAAMIGAVRYICDKNIEYVGKVYDVPDSVFQEMKRVFNIMDGLIQESLEFSKAQEDSYKC